MEGLVWVNCTQCKGAKQHKHTHDTTDGIGFKQTHIANSERYTCQTCGNNIYAAEGKRRGLKFELD